MKRKNDLNQYITIINNINVETINGIDRYDFSIKNKLKIFF